LPIIYRFERILIPSASNQAFFAADNLRRICVSLPVFSGKIAGRVPEMRS
jgi:hypothetical protein